ncbi:vitamin D3 receptor B-like [Watersipora subatra]|uniref:vitamin D3 receptor B-like n=1 Tax=Watersipora subatra TaxID=2589382 RepID=UPI00355C6672
MTCFKEATGKVISTTSLFVHGSSGIYLQLKAMASHEVFNLSSVCSGSDMNESVEDLELTHNSSDVTDDTLSQNAETENSRSELANNQNNRKSKTRKENRKCTVCGDRALGYNFDAITCESCKAFFRRNANKPKNPRCMFQNNCMIDSNTRRFCSACRLAKCFAVGMKKEMILGDDERQKRIEKVLENRAKKQIQKPASVETSDFGSTYSILDSPATVDKLGSIKSECNGELSPGFSHDRTAWPPINHPQYSFNMGDTPAESANSSRRLLGKGETDLISLISSAYCSSFGSTEDETPMRVESASLEDMANHIGVLVKLLIRFAKKLVDFIALPQTAQVSLLKGALLDCITWRSAQMFDIEKGKWIFDDGTEISVQLMGVAFEGVDNSIQEEHVALISTIKKIVGSDLTLISIVQCIVLLTPEYSVPGARALTAAAQDKHITLLKHYLEARDGWKEAFDIYAQLLSCITATKVYAVKHGKAFTRCDISRLDPLLIEVLDISRTFK